MNPTRIFLTKLATHPLALLVLFVVVFFGAPYLRGATLQILSFALVSILFTQSINVLTGMAGQISLGHAAFFGIGAYGSAIIAKTFGLNLFLTIPVAAVVSSLIAYLLSYPAGRVKEVYLAMMTLGFGQIFLEVAREWTDLTGGVMGLSGVPSAGLGTLIILGHKFSTIDYFRVLLLITACSMIFIRNFSQSRLGRSLFVMHYSELAAGSVGIARRQTKQLAYALSGLLAGISGGFYAHLVGYLGPESFAISRSIEVLVVAIVGGLWSSAGQVISAIFFTFLPEQLQLFAEYQFIAYGLILTFTLILFRQGIGGLLFLPPRFIRQAWLATAVEQQRQANAANSKTNEPQFLKIQSASVDINVQAITMQFGGLVALNSVSLDIQAGHITALVGPNGSGKSTLVNIIAGVFPPTSGQVFLQGTDVTAQADVDMAKKGVVRTFQDPRLVPHFTVRENIMLGAHAIMHYTWLEAGLSMPRVRLQEAQALEQCNEILQLLDIEAVADQAVESLPYGYRRMTELGRALLARPKIILLDEPAAGLSDVEMARLAEILIKLKHLGITVLLIEHHMDFLTGLVDEVVVLDSGSIIFKGDMLGMRQDPKVIAAYLGDDEVQHA